MGGGPRVSRERALREATVSRPLSAACRTRPSAIATRSTSSSSAPGTCAEVGRGDHALAAAAQHVDQPLPARGVELAHHVVEQQQRRGAALGGQLLALGQQQREQPEPLLAARAVGAQLAAVAPEREVVAVRAVAGEAALEVAVGALGELGGERLGRLARASAAGRRARPRPRGRAPPAWAAKRVAQARRRPRRGRASARCRGGRAPRPRPAASARRRGRPARAAISALRCASAAEYSRRVPARAGHSAATTWSRCARRSAGAPSTSSSRSGRNTATSGRAVESVSRSTGAPSTLQALRLAGLEADA